MCVTSFKVEPKVVYRASSAIDPGHIAGPIADKWLLLNKGKQRSEYEHAYASAYRLSSKRINRLCNDVRIGVHVITLLAERRSGRHFAHTVASDDEHAPRVFIPSLPEFGHKITGSNQRSYGRLSEVVTRFEEDRGYDP